MARRTTLLVTTLWLLLTAVDVAAEARDRSELRDASQHGPTIDGELSFGAPSLRAGFRTALKKIYYVKSCQALFARFESNGIEVLQNTTYTMAGSDWQQRVCRDAEAFTTVGGAEVWLCPSFGWMDDKEAAVVLLHEALHNAGLGEQPVDPEGPTAAEIDAMVKRDCRF